MLRLILLAGLVIAALLLIGSLLFRGRAGRDEGEHQGEDETKDNSKDNPRLTTKMVRCARCGLYVPAQSAVKALGRSYCGEAHWRLDNDKDADK